jgi:hypothetical protein
MRRAVYRLLSSSRHITTCKLNPLLVTLLLLGGCGIIFMGFSLAAVALHKALFSAVDGVKNEEGEKQ